MDATLATCAATPRPTRRTDRQSAALSPVLRSGSDAPVAILCAAPRNAYRQLPGVDVYDRNRDARTFTGGMPVIAHPPCRTWSVHCRHQAKPDPGEQELGLWCAEQVTRWGGILEQPAHSRLWAAAGLPLPGAAIDNTAWSIEVWQAWWGYPMQKSTWLYFKNIPPRSVTYPLRLHAPGSDWRREQLMSKQQRSATTPAFAAWLVSIARLARSTHD